MVGALRFASEPVLWLNVYFQCMNSSQRSVPHKVSLPGDLSDLLLVPGTAEGTCPTSLLELCASKHCSIRQPSNSAPLCFFGPPTLSTPLHSPLRHWASCGSLALENQDLTVCLAARLLPVPPQRLSGLEGATGRVSRTLHL